MIVTSVLVDKDTLDYVRSQYGRSTWALIDELLHIINYDEAKLMKIIKMYMRKSDKRKVTVSMPYVLHFYLRQFSSKYNVSMSTIINSVLLFLECEGFGGVVNL